jgi:hypothetical protein
MVPMQTDQWRKRAPKFKKVKMMTKMATTTHHLLAGDMYISTHAAAPISPV